MYPIHAGPHRMFMLMVWPQKYKLSQIDPNSYNTLHSPEKLHFLMCHSNSKVLQGSILSALMLSSVLKLAQVLSKRVQLGV